MTNLEYIKSMTLDEAIRFMRNEYITSCDPFDGGKSTCPYESCNDCVEAWLKQEYNGWNK